MELLDIHDAPAHLDPAATLVGDHVCVVPLRTEHAEQLQPWVDAREEGFGLVLGGPNDFDWSAAGFIAWLLDRAAEVGDIIPCAVEHVGSGELLGYSRYLHVEPKRRMAHVGGTWWAPPARGTKLNPEAKLLMLGHAFACGYNRIQIQTDLRNVRSQRAITRIGATYEGTSRADYQLRDGGVRSTWVASVLRSEWPTVRRQLEALILEAPEIPARIC